MSRFQRRLHLVLWLVVLPACAFVLWLGLSGERADESDFGITRSAEAPE